MQEADSGGARENGKHTDADADAGRTCTCRSHWGEWPSTDYWSWRRALPRSKLPFQRDAQQESVYLRRHERIRNKIRNRSVTGETHVREHHAAVVPNREPSGERSEPLRLSQWGPGRGCSWHLEGRDQDAARRPRVRDGPRTAALSCPSAHRAENTAQQRHVHRDAQQQGGPRKQAWVRGGTTARFAVLEQAGGREKCSGGARRFRGADDSPVLWSQGPPPRSTSLHHFYRVRFSLNTRHSLNRV